MSFCTPVARSAFSSSVICRSSDSTLAFTVGDRSHAACNCAVLALDGLADAAGTDATAATEQRHAPTIAERAKTPLTVSLSLRAYALTNHYRRPQDPTQRELRQVSVLNSVLSRRNMTISDISW